MSKKKRRGSAARTSPLNKLDSAALRQQAAERLAAQHWRDAIAAYKELCKREPRDDWRRALAEAYAGRAAELASKGMLKEALAIWENRTALDPSATMHPDQAALLLRLGKVEQVTALLSSADPETMPRALRESLHAQLAARILGGERGLLEQLPANDPVRAHADAAEAALIAYCNNDDQQLRDALTAIPFRSPYRDWALVLKALLVRASDPEEATALLARIDEDSPFAPVKRAAILSLEPEDRFLATAAKSPPRERQVASVLRGWPPERIALWQDLVKSGLGTDADFQALPMLRVMQRHKRILGGDWIRAKTLRLASHSDQDGLKWLRRVAGAAPSHWERALLGAWSAERHGDEWEILEGWQQCAELLKTRNSDNKDPRLAMRIALVLRRPEARLKFIDRLEASGDPELMDTELADMLEESLTWDPDDRDTYLRLIGYYRRGKLLKHARRLLDKAREHIPRDIPLLEAAMDIALDGGAFKKAAGLARQILKIDPINTGVRSRLIAAHLAHARKQTSKYRIDLARKELALAGDWARSDQARAQLALITDLLELMDDTRTAAENLRSRYADRAASYSGWLELLLAAELIGLCPADLHKQLRLNKPKPGEHADLAEAMAQLRGHLDQHGEPSRDLTESLDGTLRRAPWKTLARGQLETACDTLRRAQMPKARTGAATAALKRWAGEPVFVLHRFEAKYPYGFNFADLDEFNKLESALTRAREAGDARTAMRIEKALPFGGRFRGSPFPPPFPLDDEDDEPADDLSLDDATAALFEDMILNLGAAGALDELGAPEEFVRRMEEIEREVGPETAAEILASILQDMPPGGLGNLPLPQETPPHPTKGKGENEKGDDEDHDAPEQTSLF